MSFSGIIGSRRFWMITGQLAVLLAIAGGLVLTVDIQRTIAVIRDADALALGAAILGVQCQVLLSALRWRFTAARLGQTIDRATAIREYYVASLVNHLLPGGVSGDALRAWRNRGGQNEGSGWQVPVQAVMLERLSGQLAMIAVALAGLGVWAASEQASLPIAALTGVGAVLIVLLLIAAVIAWLARAGRSAAALFLRSLGPAFRRAFVERYAWIVQGGLSLAIVASYLGCFALVSYAIGTTLAPIAIVTLVPVILLTMLLPVSIAGWGVREATAAALWPLIGAASADGVAAGLLYGVIIVVGSLPGLWFVWRTPMSAAHGHYAPSQRA